jgi:sporulation protein YlmC with PRC-barrel domain
MQEQSIIKSTDPDKKYRRVLAASTLAGDQVQNTAGENLGKVDEIMIDIPAGKVAYAVLSFGGFLGMGNKLFAVPWRVIPGTTPNKARSNSSQNAISRSAKGNPSLERPAVSIQY